ncbi:MAG: cytochrome c3 family protein [Phycisphaerales bacterium]
MSTIFPRWTNGLPTLMAAGAAGGLVTVVGIVWYYFTPKYFDVGYMPKQPGGGFNHQIHAGKLGMDCRYCHSSIEQSAEANIPAVATCMGCHTEDKLKLWTESPTHKDKTEFIRQAYAADKPIDWRRIHKLPDYVRNFPHQSHISAGVSCVSCHGNIATMPVVYQHEPLSMSWCLECHRDPEPKLVPRKGDPKQGGGVYSDALVTRLFEAEREWVDNPAKLPTQKKFYEERHISAPESCGSCHY